MPGSRGLDLVSGFAFFVEIAAVDVVYDRDGEVLDFVFRSATLEGRGARG